MNEVPENDTWLWVAVGLPIVAGLTLMVWSVVNPQPTKLQQHSPVVASSAKSPTMYPSRHGQPWLSTR